jgi:hypothetical protein
MVPHRGSRSLMVDYRRRTVILTGWPGQRSRDRDDITHTFDWTKGHVSELEVWAPDCRNTMGKNPNPFAAELLATRI